MLNITAIGRLGKDATVNQYNDKYVINFSVAVGQKFKDGEKTYWLNCSWWVKTTGVVEYLKKGQQVYIEGWPEATLTTSKSGTTYANQDVNVNKLELLDSKKEQNEGD